MNAPLTPAGLDLRDFTYMPLDVVRLRDSDMMALSTAEGFRAAVSLWCASWHQVPAASLPNDDRVLCHLAGFGRDMPSWLAVRGEALRGFMLCTDDRFYHPVIAEKANEAKAAKDKQRNRTQAATEARKAKPNNEQRDVDRNDERNVDQEKGREEKEEVVDDRLRAADRMVSRISETAIPVGHALLGDVMAASVCIGWQKSGFDVELDAIPAVTKALAGRYRITRWDKLTSWVANHHADRMAAEMARPPPEILPPQASTVTQLRPRHEPTSHFDIGRAVASRPPPGFG